MGRLGYYSKFSFQAPKKVIPKKILAFRLTKDLSVLTYFTHNDGSLRCMPVRESLNSLVHVGIRHGRCCGYHRNGLIIGNLLGEGNVTGNIVQNVPVFGYINFPESKFA